MTKATFEELLEAVKEGGRVLRGESPPARITVIPEPDVAAIRKRHGLTQQQFAELFGVNVRTLQNWEQGRRHPRGPARLLLCILEANPRALYEVVRALRA